MATFLAPLVGMHFRPPAKAILAVLPANCPLQVIPEPDNPFDSNALQVMVRSVDIPKGQHEELDNAGRMFGYPLEDILAKEQWHLGYVKATEAIHLQPRIVDWQAMQGQYELLPCELLPCELPPCPATLSFDSAGKPLVSLDL